MTESEKICNEIGEKFFCKDYVYQGLKYRDAKNNKLELCDGLFEYGNNYIVLQIKERAKEVKGRSEESWLYDVVYGKAVSQVVKTIDGIKNNKIVVKDLYQQPVELDKNYRVYPIIIFDNEKIEDYKKVVEVDKIRINIFNIEDYQVMLKILVHPFDITYYLNERSKLFTDSFPSYIIGEGEEVSMISKINTERDVVSFFIHYIYKGDLEKQNAALKLLNIIENFRKTQKNINLDYKKILKIFQMVDPYCAIGFIERFEYALQKSIENKFDITKNIGLILDDRTICITFCASGHAPFNKKYYEVICDAKQLQHKTDVVVVIAFIYDESQADKIQIDWIYYDKVLDDDEKVQQVFEMMGMYNGGITRERFEKFCGGILSSK